jgi:hypothetical protein
MKRDIATTYLDHEGREGMRECLRLSFEWCVSGDVATVVVFTGTGEGPYFAAKELLPQPQYNNVRVVAVTPPSGRPYRSNPSDPSSPLVRAGISSSMREELGAFGISVVSAHLPFKEIHDGHTRASEWSRVAEAYGVLGGGFSLCIQAMMMACDAGTIEAGERVVSCSADTAVVAFASRTDSFLSPTDGVLVEHIICRPARYTISKQRHVLLDRMWGGPSPAEAAPPVPFPAVAPAPMLPSPGKSPAPKKRGAASKKT